jgi:hypothetical protein
MLAIDDAGAAESLDFPREVSRFKNTLGEK